MRSQIAHNICLFGLLTSVVSCSKSASEGGSSTGLDHGDEGTDSDSDSDSADRSDCQTTVNRTSPSDGASDHYYLDPIIFELSEPDPSAVFVAAIDGEEQRVTEVDVTAGEKAVVQLSFED